MAPFAENNPQEKSNTDKSIEADKENSENADGEELDLSDAKKVKKLCNVRARGYRVPPSHYRTSLELAKSWYTLSKQAQDASIEEWKAKTTVEKRAIALLIPGYAAKDAARKEKASQPTVASRTRGGNTRVDGRTTQRRAQQAQSEGVQLSTTGLAHTAVQPQSKAASIAPKRQTVHESYFKKVRRLEQGVLRNVAKLAWLTGKGNAKKPSVIKDYQLYLEMGNPYIGISSINGGRRPKRRIEEMREEIIIVGHKIKKAKHIAKYCKRAEQIATEDAEFMKDKKPILIFGQGRNNDIRVDCKLFIKKRTHDRSRPKTSSLSDAATTAAISHLAVITPESPGRIEVV